MLLKGWALELFHGTPGKLMKFAGLANKAKSVASDHINQITLRSGF